MTANTNMTPEQFLALSKEEMHAAVGYEPYIGGGGPNKAEQYACIQALYKACILAGFTAEIFENIFEDGDYSMPAVKVGRKNAVVITYDRWGFCGDYSETLDQDSLYTTILHLNQIYAG